MGNLYLVATPIGNIDDISYRAVKILKGVDVILAEDTRETGILLSNLNIKNKLISFNDHNEVNKIKIVKDMLDDGKSIALVSDRGTPLISDPGYKLVKKLRTENYNIIPIPGPVAFINALIASGLPTNNFIFLGFIQHKKKWLTDYKNLNSTLIFYEAVHRLEKFVNFLLEELGDREVVIAREITKLYESFYVGKLSNVLDKIDPIKGEFVVMVGPNKLVEHDKGAIIKDIKQSLSKESNKDIINLLMLKYNISKNEAYNLILEAKK